MTPFRKISCKFQLSSSWQSNRELILRQVLIYGVDLVYTGVTGERKFEAGVIRELKRICNEHEKCGIDNALIQFDSIFTVSSSVLMKHSSLS